MNKITVKATKLHVKDRLKIGGVTYRVTNLTKNFGRPKTKHNERFYDRVHVNAVSTDGRLDYQRISFAGDTELTARRK